MEFHDGTSFIKTQNLVKQYGRRRVVKGVNMELRAGEIVGLLGPNGAGKTTSFYMIVGLVPATEGKVFLDGADITEVPMYKRARMGIGYLPQEASVFRKLTVRQNILAVAEYLPIPKGELKDFVQSMLEELNLSHLADQPAFTLSGGSRATLSASCGTATVNCSGGSELTLNGSCDRADIVCSGGSRCYAYGFDAAAAKVDISGGSALEITVSESLTGDNSGGSHIRYKGVPARLNVNNSGGSTTSAAK